VIQVLFIGEFGLVDMRAAKYSAFLQNLLMSGLFIAMFVARRGARGQRPRQTTIRDRGVAEILLWVASKKATP